MKSIIDVNLCPAKVVSRLGQLVLLCACAMTLPSSAQDNYPARNPLPTVMPGGNQVGREATLPAIAGQRYTPPLPLPYIQPQVGQASSPLLKKEEVSPSAQSTQPPVDSVTSVSKPKQPSALPARGNMVFPSSTADAVKVDLIKGK